MRKFKRDFLWPIGGYAFAIALILLSPVPVPIEVLSHVRQQKRMAAIDNHL